MSQKTVCLRRKKTAEEEAGKTAQLGPLIPINNPPENPDEIAATCDSFTFTSFTVDDAWALGHLLHARLAPYAAPANGGKPALVSIALATGGGQTVFQCATGSGTAPDNEAWVARKRAAVLRYGRSTWFLGRKFAPSDHAAFRARYGLADHEAARYAIHGGGVPIYVRGVEGVVAVVVVSGLAQHQDHGVIVDVIRENWTPE